MVGKPSTKAPSTVTCGSTPTALPHRSASLSGNSVVEVFKGNRKRNEENGGIGNRENHACLYQNGCQNCVLLELWAMTGKTCKIASTPTLYLLSMKSKHFVKHNMVNIKRAREANKPKNRSRKKWKADPNMNTRTQNTYSASTAGQSVPISNWSPDHKSHQSYITRTA